jgi:Tol biopolymer transport system component
MFLRFSGRLLPFALLFTLDGAAATTLETISVAPIAVPQEANGSTSPALSVSSDGRYALFATDASNLIGGDTNRRRDLFFYDAQSDSIERINVRLDGTQADAGVDDNYGAAFTDDGRYVFFTSNASLLPGGMTPNVLQAYVRDRVTGTTELVLRQNDGQPYPSTIRVVDATADGRYVLLATRRSFAAGDANTHYDLYRLDRSNGELVLVSVDIDGFAGDTNTLRGQISADGRYVAFQTGARRLVADDLNSSIDVFLRDLVTNQTVLASRPVSGVPSQLSGGYLPGGNAISSDGRYVAFETFNALVAADTNNARDTYLFDRTTQAPVRVTLQYNGAQIDGGSELGSLSADGSAITFHTMAAVLPGPTDNFYRSYRRRVGETAPTEIVLSPWNWGDSTTSCQLSGDAAHTYCLFQRYSMVASTHTDFTNLYAADLPQTATRRITRPLPTPQAVANNDSAELAASASADGRFVVFDSVASNLVPDDTNNRRDVFLRDRQTGTTTRLNRLTDGSQTVCVAGKALISADGRYVAFESCDALTPGAAGGIQQVFRLDRTTGTTVLVSRTALGGEGDNSSYLSGISDDGNVIAFLSVATNLMLVTYNPRGEVYLADMAASSLTLATRRAGVAPNGGPDPWWLVRLSGDGRVLAFGHSAPDLVDGDTNGEVDVFVFDRTLAQIERVSLDGSGQQLSSYSTLEGLSRDGRQILFSAYGVTPNAGGHYVRDRVSGTLDQVNVDNDGNSLPTYDFNIALSDDGHLVAFACACADRVLGTFPPDWLGEDSVFVFDRRSRRIDPVGTIAPNDYVAVQNFARNGHALLLVSRASNLVADEGNNRFQDVFMTSALGDVLFASGLEAAP